MNRTLIFNALASSGTYRFAYTNQIRKLVRIYYISIPLCVGFAIFTDVNKILLLMLVIGAIIGIFVFKNSLDYRTIKKLIIENRSISFSMDNDTVTFSPNDIAVITKRNANTTFSSIKGPSFRKSNKIYKVDLVDSYEYNESFNWLIELTREEFKDVDCLIEELIKLGVRVEQAE